MAKPVVYEVTNIKTGEMFVGTAEDISGRLGVSRGYISKQEIQGKRVCLDWKIVKLDQRAIVEKPNNHSIPYALQEEWDKVTAPFKKLYAKKVSRAYGEM